MRFNVKEIKELACQHQCEKEGNLFFRERQEGFFRKQEGLLTPSPNHLRSLEAKPSSKIIFTHSENYKVRHEGF